MSGLVFFDTHCHIHDSEFAKKYDKSIEEIINEARGHGVKQLLCVGTDERSSQEAIEFVRDRAGFAASVALHPHEVAARGDESLATGMERLVELLNTGEKIVAIGECGLDYYYHQDEAIRTRQQELFIQHLDLAAMYDLPLIFHIRDAFDDFFDVIDRYPSIRGVVHSFSASPKELEGVVSRGLYVGLNGIMTFSKQTDQLQAAKKVPLERMMLETDAPFLTPVPFRGKMCEPKHLVTTARFLSELRGERLEDIAQQTTRNAELLFGKL